MHMSQNEQLETSTYLALGAYLRNRELLALMASIMPVEFAHFSVLQTSMAKLAGANTTTTGTGTTGTGTTGTGTTGTDTTGTGTTGGTTGGTSTGGTTGGTTSTIGSGPNANFLGTINLRDQANTIPLPILPAPAPVYLNAPVVSVVRPRSLAKAGAVATVNQLVATNQFAGQPQTFTAMMMQMAMAADGAATLAVLGPNGITTSQPELALTTLGSVGSGALTYGVRSLNGSATVINGNTSSPRVQFAGGPGTYVFELTVTDASGNTARDVATIFYQGR